MDRNSRKSVPGLGQGGEMTLYHQVEDWSSRTLNIREQFKYYLRNNPNAMRNKKEAFELFINFNEEMFTFCSQVRRRYGLSEQTQQEHIARSYEKQLTELHTKLQDEKKAKEDAMTRVSELASNMVKSGNASITELNDPYNPMKLAEEFGSTYDDEWTDAFEHLTDHASMKDEDAINFLYDIIKACHDFTLHLADNQRIRIATICSSPDTLPSDTQTPDKAGKMKQTRPLKPEEGRQELSRLDATVKEFCKAISTEGVDSVVESSSEELIKRKFPTEHLANPDVTKYYRKCAKLCWLMHAQFPPMHVEMDLKPGDPFDTDLLKEYRLRGKKVARMVWPPLRLHEGGPLVSKGTADGDGKK